MKQGDFSRGSRGAMKWQNTYPDTYPYTYQDTYMDTYADTYKHTYPYTFQVFMRELVFTLQIR